MSSLTNVGRITMLVALSRLNLAANKLMLAMFAPLDYGRLEPTFPNADVRTARRMFAVLRRLAAGLSVQALANQIMRRFKRGGSLPRSEVAHKPHGAPHALERLAGGLPQPLLHVTQALHASTARRHY